MAILCMSTLGYSFLTEQLRDAQKNLQISMVWQLKQEPVIRIDRFVDWITRGNRCIKWIWCDLFKSKPWHQVNRIDYRYFWYAVVGLLLSPFYRPHIYGRKQSKIICECPNNTEGNEVSKWILAALQSEEVGIVDGVGDEATILGQIRQLVSMLPANNEDDASYDEAHRRFESCKCRTC